MATINAGYTMLEMAKGIGPDGSQMTIAESMAVEVPIFFDIPWNPSNDIWSHKSVVQSSLPSGSWRGINEYVTPGTALTDEQIDIIGIVEDFATYDKLFIDRQPDPQKARLQRAKMYLAGMAQTICSAIFYGNTNVTPKKPHGFAPRRGSLGRYCIGANGTGSDTTSIWVVTWSGVYGIYPKHGQAPGKEFPIIHKSMTGPEGRVDTNSSGQKLVIYEDNFKFEGGICVTDPRCLGRIANIETAGTSNIFDEDNLIDLLSVMRVDNTTVIYWNETISAQARKAMASKTNVYFQPSKGIGLFGEPIMYYDAVPIRKIDSKVLLNTETAIS